MKTLNILLVLVLSPSVWLGAANLPAGQVIGWGDNASGLAIGVPFLGTTLATTTGLVKMPGQNFSNITAIAVGDSFVLGLKNDGTVTAWNYKLPENWSNMVAVAAGEGHGLALKNDGSVVGWGNNNLFGASTVPPSLSNVIAISGGYSHSLVLKNDGTVAGWGMPIIPGGLTNIVAISASRSWGGHDLALRNDGMVLGWDNRNGVPAIVPGLSNAVAISAGSSHGLALLKDGTVFGCGANDWGEATGTPDSKMGLVIINAQALSNVVAVAAGSRFSLALKQDGTIALWGRNPYHRLDVPEGLSNVVAIAAGESFCLAITTNHAVAEKFMH